MADASAATIFKIVPDFLVSTNPLGGSKSTWPQAVTMSRSNNVYFFMILIPEESNNIETLDPINGGLNLYLAIGEL